MQPRLAFPAPTADCTIALALSGLSVLIDVSALERHTALAHLAAVGVSPRVDGDLISMTVRELPLAARLPENVSILVDHLLHPLWALVCHPPEQQPASIEVLAGDLRISWLSSRRRFDEIITVDAVPALLGMDTPLVATSEGWALLSSASSLPVSVGRCQVTNEEYVLIEASKPQLVEAAPIPGLWRIDDTRFGVPLAYARVLDEARGFVWDGPRAPTQMRCFPLPDIELSAAARQTAQELTERLASFRSALLVAPAASSRRVAVASALKAASRADVLIVCAPWALWAWKRAASLCDLPVRFTTYLDLTYGEDPGRPDAVVFDDLGIVAPVLNRAASRLDSLDAMRVVVLTALPDDVSEALTLFARVKPAEFRDDVPLVVRYPVSGETRAREHMRPYVVRSSPSPGGFSRLTIDVLSLTPDLREAADLIDVVGAERVEALRELVTCGSPSHVSAKIAAALARVQAARHHNRSVCVLTSHQRFAELVSRLAKPAHLPVVPVSANSPAITESCVAVYDTDLPDLGVEEVVIADWPLSISVLDDVLPVPQHPDDGPVVTVLHIAESIDDRLALRSVRAPAPTPLARAEIGWLLS